MEIKHLLNKEINRNKWNACIKGSFNGIIYAFSWYLDIVCEEWEALVAGDYIAVMPLTPGRKFGLDYILQPFFTQQLGVFSNTLLTQKLVDDFTGAIPEKFKLVYMHLNTFNKCNNPNFKKSYGITYQLDLISPYKKLFRNYSTNTRRNIKKAYQNKIKIMTGISPNSLINLMKKNPGKQFKDLKEEDYNKIRKITSFAIRHRIGGIYGAYNSSNELCAAAFFIESHNKSIYLLNASNREGKASNAMSLLIDEFIKKNSETHLTLDFEGSKIEGVARFYSGFGGQICEFIHLKRNKLPWIVRSIKRI